MRLQPVRVLRVPFDYSGTVHTVGAVIEIPYATAATLVNQGRAEFLTGEEPTTVIQTNLAPEKAIKRRGRKPMAELPAV